MADTLDLCRWIYNETLAVRKSAYEQEGKSVSYYGIKKLLPQWKEDKPELKGVHSQVLQEVVKRVDLAYQAFFRRVKEGENPGYPRFKGYGRYDSFTYTQTGFSLKPGKLWLSKIGDIKIKLHRAIDGEIQRLNIRRMPTGKWFASFIVEVEPDEPLPKTGLSIGVDVGLKSFITLSNGEHVDNPRFFVHEENEDLNIKGMVRNHGLAKHIADAAWNKLITTTYYKAEWAGKRVELVNPSNTSQICSSCDQVVQKDLSERVHRCPFCGLTLDRDHNAALNILRLGLQSVAKA